MPARSSTREADGHRQTEILMAYSLTGILPETACANCSDKSELAIVPYHETRGGPLLAVLLLCGLCRRALKNGELGVFIEVRVAGQKGWKE